MLSLPIVIIGVSIIPYFAIRQLILSSTTGPVREFVLITVILAAFGFVSKEIITISSQTTPSQTARFMGLIGFPILLYITVVVLTPTTPIDTPDPRNTNGNENNDGTEDKETRTTIPIADSVDVTHYEP